MCTISQLQDEIVEATMVTTRGFVPVRSVEQIVGCPSAISLQRQQEGFASVRIFAKLLISHRRCSGGARGAGRRHARFRVPEIMEEQTGPTGLGVVADSG